MKNNFIRLFLLSALIVSFALKTFSQLSEGGTPPGFNLSATRKLNVELMPAINVDSMLADDAVNEQYKDRPYRFGYNHLANLNPANSGVWTTLANGDRLWQLDIKVPGAFTINLAFSHFHLPAGAKLFVYTKDHAQVLGGFTAKNNAADQFLGTELLNADEAIVEYYEPVEVAGKGSLILFRVTQGYKDLKGFLKSFGQAGACINNVNCPQYSAWSDQKRAVVCLVSGGNEFCSGALVNNTSNDGTPYILTANHCGTADGTWVFRFNWETPGCPNPGSSPSTAQSISGGSTVAHNVLSDFNLVLMNSIPPAAYNVFYAGWNHGTTAATSVTAIHHPQGDIKKCSQANNAVSPNADDEGNGLAQCWQIGQWTDGCTESGSSGSPLFDQNHRIIGQLYGGPSFCGGPQMWDFYGRFCYSWDSGGNTAPLRLRDWLDPGNTGAITNDGYDPNLIVVPLDASLTTVDSPSGASCNTTITPVITLRNAGTDTITSAAIKYHLNGNADSNFNWNGLLTPGQTINITLSALTAAAGSNTFYANVSNPNGLTDQNLANDSVHALFSTPFNAPLTEGFETAVPPASWAVTAPLSGTTWTQATVGSYGLSGNSASVDEYSPPSTTKGETADLITPYINMSNVVVPAYLSFDVAYARYDATHSDTLVVLASTDCGANWTSIYYKGGSNLATTADNTNLFTPTSSQWRRDSVSLANYMGQPAVQFDFRIISGYGNVTYLDNVNIWATAISTVLNPAKDNVSMQVFPDPFAEVFTLQFELNETQAVDAGLYSMDGKLVKGILGNVEMTAGNYRFSVNTNELSNGIYFLKLNQQFVKVEKMR